MPKDVLKKSDPLTNKTPLVDNGEFAPGVDLPPDAVSRRQMLQLMGASAALATGLSGCQRAPRRKIVSTSGMPEYMKPGQSLYYASTWTEGTSPYGMLVKTLEGRPIKIEPNGKHPINPGGTTSAMQASVLGLYDPARLRSPKAGKSALNWKSADEKIVAALTESKKTVLISRPVLGRSEIKMIQSLAAAHNIQHLVYEPSISQKRDQAQAKIYGGPVELLPRYDKAKIILSLDSDFLGTDGQTILATANFAASRKVSVKHADMSRLYCVEGIFSLTGANADHRLPLHPAKIPALAQAILASFKGGKQAIEFAKANGLDAEVMHHLLVDLRKQPGHSLVVAGPDQPAVVHAAVAQINELLGAHGSTLESRPLTATAPVDSPAVIKAALADGVDALILLGVNPAYDFPAGGFADLIKKAKFSVAHVQAPNETSALCTMALPSAHNLESWNDSEPRSGHLSLCQPMIAPLLGGRQEAESLLVWAKALNPTDTALASIEDWHGYVLGRVRDEVYPAAAAGRSFESFWENALHDGIVSPTAQLVTEERKFNAQQAQGLMHVKMLMPKVAGYALDLRPHFALLDGRFGNMAWLYELPDPVTKMVWDNAALMSTATAKSLGVDRDDVVSITVGKRTVNLPVFIQAGMAEGIIGSSYGFGRAGLSIVDDPIGMNLFPLAGPGLHTDVKVSKTNERYELVTTQKFGHEHDPKLESKDRPIVLSGTLDQYRHNSSFQKEQQHIPEMVQIHSTFENSYHARENKWGMAIDLNACTACSHCVVACQAENNIPVVGKLEVSHGREMHWLRFDRYYDLDETNPAVSFMPMLCQHCENAPCENVCPVAATTHSPEGLNEMTYNRCVGTRYCANNCPYKVRRFNYYDFPRRFIDKGNSQQLAYNPQVTVRMVGIMEKCTFCVQRITEAKFDAKRNRNLIADGSLVTACQQACPADAIIFGNLNDPNSRVSRLKADSRGYRSLEELHIEPRITYLAKVANPVAGTADAKRLTYSAGHGPAASHGPAKDGHETAPQKEKHAAPQKGGNHG